MNKLLKELIKKLQMSIKYEMNVDEDIVVMLMKIFTEAFNQAIGYKTIYNKEDIRLARQIIYDKIGYLVMKKPNITITSINKIKVHIPVVISMIADDKNKFNEAWNDLLFKKYYNEFFMPDISTVAIIKYIDAIMAYKDLHA